MMSSSTRPNPVFPAIDPGIPLPEGADALPDLSPQEELAARAKTVEFLARLSGQNLAPDAEQANTAVQLAKTMAADPSYRPDLAKYPGPTVSYLAELVNSMNSALVQELSELKHYVINKLVYEIEHAKDPKVRVQALSKLGEVDGVDAFKKRSEMTVKVKPIEEVERELKNILDNIEYKVVNALPAQDDPQEAQEDPQEAQEEIPGNESDPG